MKHLVVILLILVGCGKPTDFELVNRHDPESPNFVFDPATDFLVYIAPSEDFRFRWGGGTSNRSVVELIRIVGADTLFLYNDIPETSEMDIAIPEIVHGPFEFKMRMSLNEHVSNWLRSYTFRYIMIKPDIYINLQSEGSITVSWDRKTAGIRQWIWPTNADYMLPNKVIVLDKSVNGGDYQTIGSFETASSYVDTLLPAAGETLRYRITGFYQDTTAGPTESALITLPAQ